MEPLREVVSRTVVLPQDDIDTDQIIPARFLTTTTREGLGRNLFCDWRYRADGTPDAGFVLNRREAEGCRVLVAGHNFGCGSSREHAPWALLDYGFRAVISTAIADIFRGNALKNGLLPIVIDGDTHGWLLAHPGAEVVIDVTASTLTLPTGRSVDWPLDTFGRYCLLEGIDPLGFLMQQAGRIDAYERSRSWTP